MNTAAAASAPQIQQADLQRLLGTIKIPPQPTVVRALIEERSKDEPDIDRIIKLIENDVGLAAAVLKTVNSPFYGLRNKLGSIQSAVTMLGLKNVGTLVMGMALRNSVQVEGIERFWESASRGARIAHLLGRRVALAQTQEMHLYVLFHDAAMPLLLQSLPDYRQTIRELAGTDLCRVTELEDTRHSTNHAVVGGLLASNWGLPENIREAITYHHDFLAFDGARLSEQVMTLIAIGHVAEKLESMIFNSLTNCKWDRFGKACLSYLGLGEVELLELQDLARDFFGIDEY
jgi:HD-like signal output (HDOD) protein